MYEGFYGLREKPFALTPDPRYLFLSPAHREALDHLVYGIRQREGFIAICGDVGTGKTTLCRTLLGRLDATTKTALILNPVLSITELLRAENARTSAEKNLLNALFDYRLSYAAMELATGELAADSQAVVR